MLTGVKGSVQWYVTGTVPGIVADVLASCDARGLSLRHPRTGVTTYLNDERGHEGEQVATAAPDVAAMVDGKLDAGDPCVVQLWLDGDTDVLCQVHRVAHWESTLFRFGFDGLYPDEARKAAAILFEAERLTEHATKLWLVDFVGLGAEYGPAHEWDGAHAPAWRAPD
jgi:hypothetical protein